MPFPRLGFTGFTSFKLPSRVGSRTQCPSAMSGLSLHLQVSWFLQKSVLLIAQQMRRQGMGFDLEDPAKPTTGKIPYVLISPARPDLNPKEVFSCIRKSTSAMLWSHPLRQTNQLFLQDAGGSRVKVTKVVCSVYNLRGGPEQLRQEGRGRERGSVH